MNEEKAWLLMARKMSGDANESELAELEWLRQTDPETSFRMEVLHGLWNVAPPKRAAKIDAYHLQERLKMQSAETFTTLKTRRKKATFQITVLQIITKRIRRSIV